MINNGKKYEYQSKNIIAFIVVIIKNNKKIYIYKLYI